MYTFNKMWGVVTPDEAKAKIAEQGEDDTEDTEDVNEIADDDLIESAPQIEIEIDEPSADDDIRDDI